MYYYKLVYLLICLCYYHVLLQFGLHAYMSVLASCTTTSWCTCLYVSVIIMDQYKLVYMLICLCYHHVQLQAGVHAICLCYHHVRVEAGVHANMSVLSSCTTTCWLTCLYVFVVIMYFYKLVYMLICLCYHHVPVQAGVHAYMSVLSSCTSTSLCTCIYVSVITMYHVHAYMSV